jgi:hypothetical protein
MTNAPEDGLRTVSLEELLGFQVDRHGRLHWRGSLVKVSGRLTFWQSVGAVTLVVATVIAAAATVVQAWVAWLSIPPIPH